MAEPAVVTRAREVPQEARVRTRIREEARSYARRMRLVPPLDLDALRAAARRLCSEAGVAAEHVDFATVMLGNATWESTFAAVPFERRILLLPRCLRPSQACAARADALGLQCQRCGACATGRIGEEAEALGYHVLVAEGTSAAERLVESGRVEGVLAVACLSSLERSFAAASAGAVPALAIPLLSDGCRATRADDAWIGEALRLRRPNAGFRHFHLDRLRQDVSSWFGQEALAALLVRHGTRSEALAVRAVAVSGKRWRPTLAAAVCQALRGSDGPPDATVRRVAVAVECFHKASLVHDDIEDGDLVRSGEPTLEQAHGMPVALNVGDLLIGEGYRLLAEASAPPQTVVAMLSVAARGQRELCLGQGEELLWAREPRRLRRAEALDMLRRKTAPAFEVALVLGALLAGGDEETRQALAGLSAALGLAYQIRDDIEDSLTEEGGATPAPLFVALSDEDGARALLDPTLPAGERRRLVEACLPEAWTLFDRYRAEALQAARPIACQPLKGLLFRLLYLFLGRSRSGWERRVVSAASQEGAGAR